MSGPKDGRGPDAFDDFFGDPTPSGRMGPAPESSDQPEIADDGDPTRDIDLRGEQTAAATAPAPAHDRPVEPAPTGAVPEDWWTSDPEPTPPAAASPTWHAAPVPQAQPTGPPPAGRPPKRGVSPFALVAMLLGGVLLGGLCVGGTVMALNQDEGESAASQTTVTETSSETPTSTDTPTSSSTSSSTTSSSSTSSSPTRSGELPAGVRSCAGPKSGVAVGRGTEVTSCDFAVAVREAYLAEKPEGDVTLEVRSPVTEESYGMSCSGQAVTRCTGGNDAVVVLY